MKRLTVLLLMVMLVRPCPHRLRSQGNINAAGGSQTIDVSARYIPATTPPFTA